MTDNTATCNKQVNGAEHFRRLTKGTLTPWHREGEQCCAKIKRAEYSGTVTWCTSVPLRSRKAPAHSKYISETHGGMAWCTLQPLRSRKEALHTKAIQRFKTYGCSSLIKASASIISFLYFRIFLARPVISSPWVPGIRGDYCPLLNCRWLFPFVGPRYTRLLLPTF